MSNDNPAPQGPPAPGGSPAPSPAPAPAPSPGPAPAPAPAGPSAPPPTETKPKVPDEYKFELKDPEGNALEIDAEIVKAFSPLLKKHGITQEGANELAQAFMAELTRQDNVLSELYVGQRDSWATSAKADKEFGGQNFDANVAVARRAIARFGNDGLKSLLNETGLGNHPEVLRFFWKVGQKISEDSHVPGGNAGAGSEGDIAAKLFNHPTSKALS
jgi:hypothetical protein